MRHIITAVCLISLCEAKELWDLRADALYLHAHESGLSYGISEKGSVKNLDFDWDLGFRVGLGRELPHDNWDLQILFTHLHTKAFGNSNEATAPSWMLPGTLSFAETARARWRLHLGLLDLGIGKWLSAARKIEIRPCVGIRAAWVRQKYKILYYFPDEIEEINAKNKFFGMGILGGAESLWSFAKDWSLLGKGAFSLLYGDFYVHQDEDANLRKEQPLKLLSTFPSLQPVFELALGLSYKHSLKQEKYFITSSILWEQIFLFSQNQFIHFTGGGREVTSQDALALQGVSLSFSLAF